MCKIIRYGVSKIMEEFQEHIEQALSKWGNNIFAYLYVRLNNRERALELTQDVFTNAWNYLQKGGTISHMKAFLFKSAHNLFVNEIRTDRKMYSLEVLREQGFDPHVENEEEDRLEQHLILEKLKSLDDIYKEVLTLRYVDGFSVKEIAELLAVAENTVSVRIHRGVEKLKKLYNA